MRSDCVIESWTTSARREDSTWNSDCARSQRIAFTMSTWPSPDARPVDCSSWTVAGAADKGRLHARVVDQHVVAGPAVDRDWAEAEGPDGRVDGDGIAAVAGVYHESVADQRGHGAAVELARQRSCPGDASTTRDDVARIVDRQLPGDD